MFAGRRSNPHRLVLFKLQFHIKCQNHVSDLTPTSSVLSDIVFGSS
jgi:hypothetical protein